MEVRKRQGLTKPRSSVAGMVIALVFASCSTTPEREVARPRAEQPDSIRFVDVTSDAGIELDPKRSWGSVWNDYDGDGWPDLLVGRHFFSPVLFHNDRGTFTPREGQDALWEDRMDRHSCAWGEATGDGGVDLFCGQGAQRGRGEGPNALYVQDETHSLQDRARALGVTDPPARQRSANWLDYDSDGDLDLFVGNKLRSGFPNALFVNEGGVFERRSRGLSHELKTDSSAWADWDNDGDPDLLVTQEDLPTVAYRNDGGFFQRVRLKRVTGRNWTSGSWGDFDGDGWIDLHLADRRKSVLFRNERGRFRAFHKTRGAENRSGVFFDADNDGDLDLFVVRGAPGLGDVPGIDRRDLLLVNKPTGFEVIKIRASGPRDGNGDDVSAADYDRDGRVDLFVTNGYKRSAGPFVLLRNVTEAQNWAGIDLIGPPANPQGIGVRLIVKIEDASYHRHMTDGVAFRGQSEVGYLHLGLGSASSAEVVIRWPEGDRDCLTAAAGEIVEAPIGARPCSNLDQEPTP